MGAGSSDSGVVVSRATTVQLQKKELGAPDYQRVPPESSHAITNRTVKDLDKLRSTLDGCSVDVRYLRALAQREPNPEHVLDLNAAVSQQIEDVRRRYCRVLRKQVADEMFKLQGILETLHKYETREEFNVRGHKTLLHSVTEYNDLHFRLTPAVCASRSMLERAVQQHEREDEQRFRWDCNSIFGRLLLDNSYRNRF